MNTRPRTPRRVRSSAPYTIAPLHATPAALALAPRYSGLDGAWSDLHPGMVIRNAVGEVVAGHADQLPWLTADSIKAR